MFNVDDIIDWMIFVMKVLSKIDEWKFNFVFYVWDVCEMFDDCNKGY